MTTRHLKLCLPIAAVIAGLLLSAGCTVGPNYHRPAAEVPAKWDITPPWREGTPMDNLPKGAWWSVYQDAELDGLEQQALDANQTLKVAVAHLEQARATAAIQVATNFPTFGLVPSSTQPSAERNRLSGGRPTTSPNISSKAFTENTYTIPFAVNYEVDLFGQRRRSIESAQAAYQANAADLENVRLVITAELAGDLFTLRQQDTEIGILNRTVDALEKGLELVQSRHDGGIASGLDVAEEETFLDTARTQAILLQQQRKQSEDAIAVLIGKPAPDFHLAAKEIESSPPDIALGLPSDLLERRPDVAEAERQMASTNAQIGVAKAAYYPSLNLFGGTGFQTANVANLITGPSIFWALGANIAEPIFTGGTRRAQLQYARAGYDASVANYRATVLNAFREVQDSVAGLSVLEQAQQAQQAAVDSARNTLDISINRYKGGLVSYLDVVTAQQTLLNNEQQLATIRGQRLVTSVLLVKALGGGWDSASLSAVHVKTQLKDIVAP
ncbi:MAG: efflux transporter outer membrane subunit [Candidatus Acidiferrum sp.]|jgi:NodT family efflux transporter outer membrane factor (OMF) lipoprotein